MGDGNLDHVGMMLTILTRLGRAACSGESSSFQSIDWCGPWSCHCGVTLGPSRRRMWFGYALRGPDWHRLNFF